MRLWPREQAKTKINADYRMAVPTEADRGNSRGNNDSDGLRPTTTTTTTTVPMFPQIKGVLMREAFFREAREKISLQKDRYPYRAWEQAKKSAIMQVKGAVSLFLGRGNTGTRISVVFGEKCARRGVLW